MIFTIEWQDTGIIEHVDTLLQVLQKVAKKYPEYISIQEKNSRRFWRTREEWITGKPAIVRLKCI